MRYFQLLVSVLDACVVGYVSLFFLINAGFLAISFYFVSRDLRKEHVRPALDAEKMRFAPRITLLVPAYNEEVTISESIRSLLRLRYPSFEIVICNDGSKDKTVEVLLKTFHFVRTELEYNDRLHCAKIRAFYEVREGLVPGLTRLVLIDKENGGKADALNAAINVAQGDYVTSMDADSLLTPDALLLAARPIIESEEDIVAVGTQVGISNGSLVEDGRVVEMRLPKRWIARYQIVEYMRSFTQGRVAFAAVRSLLILSGVFALMKRELVVEVGGFLTKGMKSKIGIEYCGTGAHTVCEDMEVVVRLHRYLLDKKLPGKVTILPFATAWTECPENYKDIGKQRSRWYRGLLEVLNYHRRVIFNPRYKQIGLFSIPYQLVFEALAPIIEFFGYVALLLTAVVGVLSVGALLQFLALAMAINLSLTTLSILLCIYTEKGSPAQAGRIALFPYPRMRDVLVLLVAGFVSNIGYRQYLVAWQIKGLIDFFKGKKGWDKFARKGFAPAT
ncbi:MAG TPA: glycosyltransferase [Polyangiaceae bacterium]|jgi:cellulose synthase/poly-beta-1,6-N-acetylglucosamine synthase-like glycosyltransferase